MAHHSCHAVRCAALAGLPSGAVEGGITWRPNEVPMSSCTFATTGRILCETGAASRLAQLCRERDAQRALLLTDPGITRVGLLNAALPDFVAHGMYVEVFDQVLADPPEEVVLAAVRQAREMNAQLVIGFGGGSSMHVAKLVALLAPPHAHQSLAEIYG